MNTEILDTELEGKIVGIAHYRTMPRSIKGQYIGFLDYWNRICDPN